MDDRKDKRDTSPSSAGAIRRAQIQRDALNGQKAEVVERVLQGWVVHVTDPPNKPDWTGYFTFLLYKSPVMADNLDSGEN